MTRGKTRASLRGRLAEGNTSSPNSSLSDLLNLQGSLSETDRRLRQRAVECRPDHVHSCVNWHLIGFAFH